MIPPAYSQPVIVPYLLAQDLLDAGDRLVDRLLGDFEAKGCTAAKLRSNLEPIADASESWLPHV
jgi:hypothetical protein